MPFSRYALGIRRQLLALRDRYTRPFLPIIFSESAPLDLRIVGRTLLHAALVGLAAGVAGSLFFAALEYTQALLLERTAGYVPLRAHGEEFFKITHVGEFRPWLLALLPAVGGLLCGLLIRLAPEVRGGGGDAMIEAFHYHGGVIRRKVIWVKALASLCTLGTGGAGGREGPTMQIGGALGAWTARVLHVSARERRILLVAGVAAGISAVFRTPLGAALLAVEVLYKDGFESDALIPSVLASVIAYSVAISVFGESVLFAYVPRFPFVPAHLPLFAVLALVVALHASFFLWTFGKVRQLFTKLKVPDWTKPAFGGLLLGVLVTPLIVVMGNQIHAPGHGLGILGGGYGAVQMAISGSELLKPGWFGVALLASLAIIKILAASLTIGSGGSAGDFAPSLAIGGLLGGAFGRAAQILLDDPRIAPGAFALVGMSAFYGGIAHVPLSALVLTCELAGNYDLLVPLMLSQGIAFVALRNRALYSSQVATLGDSPVHRDALVLDVLRALKVADVMKAGGNVVAFSANTPTPLMIERVGDAGSQDLFPIVDHDNKLLGIVTPTSLRVLAAEYEHARWTVALDLMQPAVAIHATDDLRLATERMIANSLGELPVIDEAGHVIGLVNESDIANVYLKAAVRAEASDRVTAVSITPIP